jgi:hypothetical protein
MGVERAVGGEPSGDELDAGSVQGTDYGADDFLRVLFVFGEHPDKGFWGVPSVDGDDAIS